MPTWRNQTAHAQCTQEAKLLAYTSLCRPILEYADIVWDPSAKCKVHDLKIIQNKAIIFIANLKDMKTA